jgi:2-polyprenyl-6-methoxyphenol hydroxylase-like FAD-dependent oxidoreductase
MSTPGFKNVIVVGAGPAGLLLSLLLAKKGISVLTVDAADKLDSLPRATHYGPPAVYELIRAGVIDEVRAQGFIPRTVCWRKLDGTYLAGLDGSILDGDADRLTCLPLDKLGQVLYNNLKAQPTSTIQWNYRVTDIGQDEGKAWVLVETPEGSKRLEADYIIGCDGANSQIRRSLFGDFNFPGKTWDEQIVATNVCASPTSSNENLPDEITNICLQTYYDFAKYGYEDANFIIDREHWHMASRISKDGLWRVTYGEIPGLSREELLARQPAKFEQFLPGSPKPDQYRIASISPYKVHQRLAEKMRVGRFLLAADAAHLCNPL